jgi:hypothetical protein
MRRWSGHVTAVLFCSLVLLGVLAGPSYGLIVTSDNPGYSTAPYNDPGWDNVGWMSNGTGVYIGDGWVLTPFHVYRHEAERSSIVLDQEYDEIPGTARRVKSSSGVNGDLVMFRINGNPEIDGLNIRYNDVVGNLTTTIISNGLIQVGGVVTETIGSKQYKYFNTSYPDVSWTEPERPWPPDITDPTTPPVEDWIAPSRGMRWGTNKIPSSYGIDIPLTMNGITTDSFVTWFDLNGGNSEAQPLDKDSGGAVFIKNGGDWELSGLVLAIATPQGYSSDAPNPLTHAVYGNAAYYANLSEYYADIAAIRLRPLPGDADWNGTVDALDLEELLATFGSVGEGYSTDFNEDNLVDLADFTILRDNFGMISGSGNGLEPPDNLLLGPPIATPEPTTVFLLIAGIPAIMKLRKRRREA